MKSYFVTSGNMDDMKSALGPLIEYAMFLAGEYGSRERVAFVKEILDECNIEVEEVDM